ncbi:DUF3606 domain-containing protein [Dankookia rubra]|uniref:DUF3606 domain-containing protein n=1 Tax=Dankookia rubra TaxID=1442381 RepID=A0A4R5Q6X2_9PROT|nr:DUF3606 domain-containing protein [Dankookia rubra]
MLLDTASVGFLPEATTTSKAPVIALAILSAASPWERTRLLPRLTAVPIRCTSTFRSITTAKRQRMMLDQRRPACRNRVRWPRTAAYTRKSVANSGRHRHCNCAAVIRWNLAASTGPVGVLRMDATTRKPTSWERAQVDITKAPEVMGWCNKWKVTPERLKAVVAEVGTSAVSVAKALGRSD